MGTKWAVPEFRVEKVNAAARSVLDPHTEPDTWVSALDVINNWRSAHNFPLNTFQVNLRRRARKVDGHAAIAAQRIKRLRSILAKLRREEKMKLSQMQDIGGCRAIVSNIGKVSQLVTLYLDAEDEGRQRHVRASMDDYISEPRKSGYRGVHLVYRHFSSKPEYDGLKIEIQMRSAYQHAWATAVETVGYFTGDPNLKAGIGDEDWTRFFALMSSEIATRERCPLVPATPQSRQELRAELRERAQTLNVIERLRAYSRAMESYEQGPANAHYYVLSLQPEEQRLTITGFPREQVAKADALIAELEKLQMQDPSLDVVRVSVDSLAELREAYPNYYADSEVFIGLLENAIRKR